MHINANSLQMLLVVALSGWGLWNAFLWLKPAFTTLTFPILSLLSPYAPGRQWSPTGGGPFLLSVEGWCRHGPVKHCVYCLGKWGLGKVAMRDTLGKRLDAATYGCDIVSSWGHCVYLRITCRADSDRKWKWKPLSRGPTLCHPMDYAIQEIPLARILR